MKGQGSFADMNTIWLSHTKYPGYVFSPEGNCISLRQNRNKLRKPQKRGEYRFLMLCNNGIRVQVFVHRIIAEIFLKPEKDRPHVNHKDGNPSNNHVDNLEWVSHSENRKHACRVLRKGIGSKNGNSKLNETQVKEIKEMLLKKVSHRIIAKKFNVARTAITSITSINQGHTWNDQRSYK